MPLNKYSKKVSSAFISTNKKQLSRLKTKLDSIDADSSRRAIPELKPAKMPDFQNKKNR